MLTGPARLRWAQIHRILGLGLAGWVVLMAITGALLAFEPRIDAALHPSATGDRVQRTLAPGPDDLARLLQHAPGNDSKRIVFERNGLVRLHVPDAQGRRQVLVIDAAQGQVLATAADGGSLRSTLINLHDSLLLGEPGRVAATALGLLFVALAIGGLVLAWPAGGRWRTVLQPPRGLPQVAMVRGWHRWIGLWLVTLLAPLILTGVWVSVSVHLMSDAPAPPPRSSSQALAAPLPALLAGAIAQSVAALPDHRLARVDLPGSPGDAIAVVMQGTAGVYAGINRRVWFDAAQSRLIAVDPPPALASLDGLMSAAYALHSGHLFGPLGAWLVVLFAIACTAAALLGVTYWWLRRRQMQRSAARKESR
ncbi:MAG TPA: PepSY-associated TM helix domain-containing protein [Rubrivivax sp.]|nr:PepSY-associated TM helix domain-containing protein [Rubrivivax sp.]